MKPGYLTRFDAAIAAAREEYLGRESDIGNWIYSQQGSSNPEKLADIAENCLYRIRKGISIEFDKTEARI